MKITPFYAGAIRTLLSTLGALLKVSPSLEPAGLPRSSGRGRGETRPLPTRSQTGIGLAAGGIVRASRRDLGAGTRPALGDPPISALFMEFRRGGAKVERSEKFLYLVLVLSSVWALGGCFGVW